MIKHDSVLRFEARTTPQRTLRIAIADHPVFPIDRWLSTHPDFLKVAIKLGAVDDDAIRRFYLENGRNSIR